MPIRVRSDNKESSRLKADIDKSEAEKSVTKEERYIY